MAVRDQPGSSRQSDKTRSSQHALTMADLTPRHIRDELNSPYMHLVSSTTLVDPQTVGAQGKFTVKPDEVVKKIIHVRAFKDALYTDVAHTALICNTINDIFISKNAHDDDAIRLFVQAMILFVGRDVVPSTGLVQALDKAGYTLEIEEIDQDNAAELQMLYHDEDTQQCKRTVGAADVSNPWVLMLAYCGTILLLAGKQVTELSAEAWTRKRVRGLTAAMGSVIDLGKVIAFDTQQAVRIYQKISMMTPLRAAVVRVLFGSVKQGSTIGMAAAAMLNLLAWSEMNHVKMVQEYLFGRFPELLAIKQLQGTSLGVLADAWRYLSSLPEHERPYVKLLYSPMQTKALQRDRFVLLTDAAHAVGSYLHASLANYQGDTEGSAGQAIKAAVRTYLDRLAKTSTAFAQAAQVANTDQRLLARIDEGKLLFDDDYEAIKNDVEEMVRS